MNEAEPYLPSSLFPCDNGLEIPSLRPDLQAQTVETPIVAFGEQRRTFDMGGTGTLHFYVDDYRFSTLYSHPEKILKHRPGSIIEPNFSLYNETAVADGLHQIYWKRQIARSLQEMGVRVFVDLNVANKFYAYNLIGVPMGWAAFATRGYDDRLDALEFEHSIAERVADGNRLLFAVYGGGDRVQAWCNAHHCVYITPLIILKNRLKALQRMARNTDTKLFRKELDFGPTAPCLEDLLKGQVLDFTLKDKLLE